MLVQKYGVWERGGKNMSHFFNISNGNDEWQQRATDGGRIRRCANGAKGKRGKVLKGWT